MFYSYKNLNLFCRVEWAKLRRPMWKSQSKFCPFISQKREKRRWQVYGLFHEALFYKGLFTVSSTKLRAWV